MSANEAAVVRAARSPRLLHLFGRYLRWYAGRRFAAMRLLGGIPSVRPDRPLIVYCNHPSWWDVAVIVLLSTGPFRDRPCFGPMDEVGIQQYGFLRRLGIFGVEMGSPRGGAKFLRTALGLAEDPRTALWILPEGRFVDCRTRPIVMKPGLAHLARHLPDAVFLPMALEYPFWDQTTPEALIHLGEPFSGDAGMTLEAWTDLLAGKLTEAMDRLAAASQTRDPALFETLIGGRVGVGGMYDLWRSAKAALRRERFDPSHRSRRP